MDERGKKRKGGRERSAAGPLTGAAGGRVAGRACGLYALASGVGWWLGSIDALRRVIENVAKNQFMAKEDHDPVDCSLFYLALGKRKVTHQQQLHQPNEPLFFYCRGRVHALTRTAMACLPARARR